MAHGNLAAVTPGLGPKMSKEEENTEQEGFSQQQILNPPPIKPLPQSPSNAFAGIQMPESWIGELKKNGINSAQELKEYFPNEADLKQLVAQIAPNHNIIQERKFITCLYMHNILYLNIF